MSPRVVVLGGGFVGQLVQLVLPEVTVFDNRPSAPKDHMETRQGPQYLWQPIPGLPSTSFKVITTIDGAPATEQSIKAYKRKIGKLRDGGDWGKQFEYETVGYDCAMPIPRVEYNKHVMMVDLVSKQLGMIDGTLVNYDILINTIPLTKFLALVMIGPQHSDPFKFDPIFMTVFRNPLAHGGDTINLNYISHPNEPIYRQTHRHGDIYSESLQALPNGRTLWPGKIHPNKDADRIVMELSTYDCWSFGRFATWRPDELAHETYEDIKTMVEVRL